MARELLLRLGHQGLKLGRTGIERTEIDRQTRQAHPRLPHVRGRFAGGLHRGHQRARDLLGIAELRQLGLHLQPGALESAAAGAAWHASSRASSTDRARRVGKAEEETRSGGRRRAGGPRRSRSGIVAHVDATHEVRVEITPGGSTITAGAGPSTRATRGSRPPSRRPWASAGTRRTHRWHKPGVRSLLRRHDGRGDQRGDDGVA